jgi:chromosome segregation ATPase
VNAPLPKTIDRVLLLFNSVDESEIESYIRLTKQEEGLLEDQSTNRVKINIENKVIHLETELHSLRAEIAELRKQQQSNQEEDVREDKEDRDSQKEKDNVEEEEEDINMQHHIEENVNEEVDDKQVHEHVEVQVKEYVEEQLHEQQPQAQFKQEEDQQEPLNVDDQVQDEVAPEFGGLIIFANDYAAYDRVPESMRTIIEEFIKNPLTG